MQRSQTNRFPGTCIRIVSDRLGSALVTVQHTRSQAAALSQCHEKIVASERERQRLNAIERQRAAERAKHNDDEGALDLLGQGNDMASFEVGDQLSEHFGF